MPHISPLDKSKHRLHVNDLLLPFSCFLFFPSQLLLQGWVSFIKVYEGNMKAINMIVSVLNRGVYSVST